ncbi:MFS transporter [Corynebacterium caspium]|uniref:MFS transporter n=1 Tax=Corynebacterium caspium TaxID=234828 RepID=UPI000372E110|nr:MFS transporter [Corynebacterium caspium]WKD58833.1 4-hydroxybenzoate transporter PcaK [Corynebacterium caspium DSM 44850]
MDIRALIDFSRMSTYQWFIIGLAAVLNSLDGFDLVAMAFTAHAVSAEFGLTSLELGWLFSAALLGMGIGSVACGPAADRWGRKRLIIVSLLVDLLGLSATAYADSYFELLLFRLFTGIGVGGILACITVVTSEFSSLRYRGLAMSIYASGYGIGAAICGLVSAEIIPTWGWRAVYGIGALLTVLVGSLIVIFLPESTDYLRYRRPPGWEAAIARTAQRFRLDTQIPAGKTAPAVAAVPAVAPAAAVAAPPARSVPPANSTQGLRESIFSTRFLATTLYLWLAFCLVTFAFSVTQAWTPKLLIQVGMTPDQGIFGGIALSLGGTLGSLLFGALTTLRSSRAIFMVFTGCSTLALGGFIAALSWPYLAFGIGVLVGMLLNGCVTGMYTITPASYSPDIRATGVGAAIAASRVGAVVAPAIIGWLIDIGWTPQSLYMVIAVVIAGAGFAMWGVSKQAVRTAYSA